jgi:hypothetical protein
MLTLGACTSTGASTGAGRFTPQQPADPWPTPDTGRQMGTD